MAKHAYHKLSSSTTYQDKKAEQLYGCILDGRDDLYSLGEHESDMLMLCLPNVSTGLLQGRSTAARHARDRSAVLDTYLI